ncbi:leucyl aminopeptidase family protein [Sphingobium amiense]|uniref:Leucyl aminopeptidase family protein n=1 Tax=Sphingobium amiense TaxID=135719 RepID=A0A494WDJ6_9SPHN|nr:leucyl aminopeptidase family protein [Sphingobium amiense]BBD98802.1 leucyl aminopeptidase family protein [Sphingobium amiense]
MTQTRWQTLRVDPVASSDHVLAGLVLLTGSGEIISDVANVDDLAAIVGSLAPIEPGRAIELFGADQKRRLLVLGVDTGTKDCWLLAGGHLFDAMVAHRFEEISLPAVSLIGIDAFHAMLKGALLHGFQLENGRKTARRGFRPQRLIVQEADRASADVISTIVEAVNRSRAWVESPSNLLNPVTWAAESQTVFEALGCKVSVLGPAELEAAGAGALLAVARGGEFGARLVSVEWCGDPGRSSWDAILVGKGLTFDAGGLNVKSASEMHKMRSDMGGGAAVFGALELAAKRASRVNVVAIVPMSENQIDALSYRPGDILTSMSGLTIEVGNTDAEGRLVLADAMTWGIRKYRPTWTIDVATLTGMAGAILSEEYAAFYASDDQLAEDLVRAGRASGEWLWRFPYHSSQEYVVESEVADVSNVGVPGYLGMGWGSPLAGALFLEKFREHTKWAHLDIEGVVWATRRRSLGGKGGTGFGALLLDQWLQIIETDIDL